MEMRNRMTEYVDLFKEARNKVGDDQIALAVLEQVGKDCRVERMNSPARSKASSGGSSQATEKQVAFLKQLGVEAPAGVSKQGASELIDQAQDK